MYEMAVSIYLKFISFTLKFSSGKKLKTRIQSGFQKIDTILKENRSIF
ncbi:hypothetical protein PARMER_02403 [Parabacteroides merdae ATCC 43184]|jgi:hypothetical protein|nr:hypothetical protein PARMER_02403 [Parabacteroides merdae ATCC 43184]